MHELGSFSIYNTEAFQGLTKAPKVKAPDKRTNDEVKPKGSSLYIYAKRTLTTRNLYELPLETMMQRDYLTSFSFYYSVSHCNSLPSD